MNWSQFLQTASADHATALAEAMAYEETRYSKITSNHAMQFASITGMLDALEANTSNQAATQYELVPGLPTTIGSLCKGALNTLNSAEGKFAIEPGTDEGDLNRAALAELQTAEVLQAGHVLGFLSLGEELVKPFANKTLYDVLIERNACPTSNNVTKDGHFAVITTTEDCPLHNPRLFAKSSRTGKWQRVNNFRGVAEQGNYESLLPIEWRNAELRVDDPYNAIGGGDG